MRKFASRAQYADPCVRVKREGKANYLIFFLITPLKFFMRTKIVQNRSMHDT